MYRLDSCWMDDDELLLWENAVAWFQIRYFLCVGCVFFPMGLVFPICSSNTIQFQPFSCHIIVLQPLLQCSWYCTVEIRPFIFLSTASLVLCVFKAWLPTLGSYCLAPGINIPICLQQPRVRSYVSYVYFFPNWLVWWWMQSLNAWACA